jgi:hypothetical protein
MRLKRVRRFGVAGVVVAAATTALVVSVPSTASAAGDWKCFGTAVKRCATVWWDEAADTYQARAKITDVAGGRDYEVKVTNVKLLRTNKAEWVTVRTNADTDGWHATEDSAGTSTVDPCSYPGQSYSVEATFSWRDGNSGEDVWRPSHSWGHLCA